jgi:hypothetical protein
MKLTMDLAVDQIHVDSFPSFEVAIQPFTSGNDLVIYIIDSDNKQDTTCGLVHMPMLQAVQQIKQDVFVFLPSHKKRSFRVCAEMQHHGKTLAVCYSMAFVVTSRRVKKPDMMDASTLLLDMPGIGLGYARRLESLHLRTLSDLAETSLTSKEIYQQCFAHSDQQVFETLLTEILSQHQEPKDIIREIQKRCFLSFSDSVSSNHFTLSPQRIHQLKVMADQVCKGVRQPNKRIRC